MSVTMKAQSMTRPHLSHFPHRLYYCSKLLCPFQAKPCMKCFQAEGPERCVSSKKKSSQLFQPEPAEGCLWEWKMGVKWGKNLSEWWQLFVFKNFQLLKFSPWYPGESTASKQRDTVHKDRRKPFQAEFTEGKQVPKARAAPSWTGLFRSEPEESNSSSSQSDCPGKQQLSTRTFDFGWQKLHAAARARLAGDAAQAGRPEKKKRHYDNTKRAQASTYKRTSKRGKFIKNGLSPQRLVSVLATDPCHWHLMMVSAQYLFVLLSDFFPI